MRELYIIGAGGFGREIAWLIDRINEREATWDLKGFLDDDQRIWGEILNNRKVLGGIEYLHSINHEIWTLCAIGASKTRKRVIERLSGLDHIRFATVVDPSVQISKLVHIGEGTMICAGSIITVNIAIGKHNIINLDCTIGHDAVLDDYVTLYPSVNISGESLIGAETELGTGTQTIQGISVGCGSIIGAGSVVIRNIPDRCVAVGNPARPIKILDADEMPPCIDAK